MENRQNTQTQQEAIAVWKNYCMNLCRQKRDKLLSATDYIFYPDVTVSEEYKQALIVYRQQLRDYPETFSAWFDQASEEEKYSVTEQSITFPEKPTGGNQ